MHSISFHGLCFYPMLICVSLYSEEGSDPASSGAKEPILTQDMDTYPVPPSRSSPEQEAAAQTMLTAMHAKSLFDALVNADFHQRFRAIRSHFQGNQLAKLDSTLAEEMDMLSDDTLWNKVAPLMAWQWAQSMSVDEMQQCTIFCKTPAGEKLSKSMIELCETPMSIIAHEVDKMMPQARQNMAFRVPELAQLTQVQELPDFVVFGAAFPDFHGTSMAGDDISLHALKGKVVLIHFWAPEVAEKPMWDILHKLYDENHDQGLEIVSIGHGADHSALSEMIHERGLPWPQLMCGVDEVMSVPLAAHMGATAEVFLINRDGILTAMDKPCARFARDITKAMAKP